MTLNRRPGTTVLADAGSTCHPRRRSRVYRVVRATLLTTVGFFVGIPVLVGVVLGLTGVAIDPPPASAPKATTAMVVEEHYVAPAVEKLVADKPVSTRRKLVMPGGEDILVWRDADALADGMAMIKASVHLTKPEAIMARVACVVPNGTEVGNTDWAWNGTIDVTVLAGESVGCRGTIVMEQLKVLD